MKRVIAVGGGKGGVGKSLIAANLAITLAQTGRRVILVDADLGGANLHTLFGLDRPKHLLEQFISRDVEHLDELLIPTQCEGLSLICGGMPILGTANPKFSQKVRLINHITALDTDVLIMDIGAGVGFNVLDLFNAAAIRLVVFTPQLTSLHNGYGFLKAAILRKLQRHISKEARAHLTSAGPEAGGESLATVLNRLAKHAPGQAHDALQLVDDYLVFLVGNMIRSKNENQVLAAIGNMIKDHLQLNAPVIGLVRYGEKMLRSVNERRPFMYWAGIESNAEAFRSMAARVLRVRLDGRYQRRSSLPGAEPAPSAPLQPYERKDPRFPVNWRAILTRRGKEYLGKMVNLAHGGAMVVFVRKVDAGVYGEPARLTIGPTNDGDTVTLAVEERHRDDSWRRLGFAFLDVKGRDQEKLERLVATAAAATAMDRKKE